MPDLGPYADAPWPEVEKKLAAMVTRLDRDVGRLRAALAESGLADDTLFVFTSDNGPHDGDGHDVDFFDSNGPLRGMKRDLYEGGLRVPMLAVWPGRIAPGTVTDHVSAFYDWLPTVAELLGRPTPPGTDGLSFLPSLLGEADAQAKHDYLYWEFTEQGGKQAVLMGDWKGVRRNVTRRDEPPLELYNLSADVGETTDVAADHPDIVNSLKRAMNEARTSSELYPLTRAEVAAGKAATAVTARPGADGQD